MLQSFKLLLPAVLPSWRFFDHIAPSPRVHYVLLDALRQPLGEWREFRPRPATLPMAVLIRRLFWNPQWNESLFMMSCAERIISQSSTHAENEILSRLIAAWRQQSLPMEPEAHYLQFRLQFIHREAGELRQQVLFTSRQVALTESAS